MSSWNQTEKSWGDEIKEFGVSLIKVYIPIFIALAIFIAFIFVPTIIHVLVKEKLTDKTIQLKINDLLKHQSPLIDGHNDMPMYVYRSILHADREPDLNEEHSTNGSSTLQTDIPRLKKGENSATFFSIYRPCSESDSEIPVGAGLSNTTNADYFNQAVKTIDFINRVFKKYGDYFVPATTAEDIRNIFIDSQSPTVPRKLAALLGVEGGHMIGEDLSALRTLYKLGARYLTLTHSCSTNWALSAYDSYDDAANGLTEFGVSVVREMNRLGMLVDLSHTAPATMRAAMNVSLSPVIFSHSNAYGLCKHVRNVPDDVLLSLKKNKGIIMLNFHPPFVTETERIKFEEIYEQYKDESYAKKAELMREWQQANPELRATVENVVDHIDYIKNLTGTVDNIGLGSDFDGSFLYTKNLEDVAHTRIILEVMMRRGYNLEQIKQVAGTNLLRVLDRNEYVASVLGPRHTNDPITV